MVDIFAKVKYHYTPQADDELVMSAGEVLQIIALLEDDWLLAKNNNGTTGMVPANYLASLPDGWSVARDPEDDVPYYFNEESGATQWEFPDATLEVDDNLLVPHSDHHGHIHGFKGQVPSKPNASKPKSMQSPGGGGGGGSGKKGHETPPITKSSLSRQNSGVMYIIEEIQAEQQEAALSFSKQRAIEQAAMNASLESVAPFEGTFDNDTIAPLADDDLPDHNNGDGGESGNGMNQKMSRFYSQDSALRTDSGDNSVNNSDRNSKYPGLKKANKSSNDIHNLSPALMSRKSSNAGNSSGAGNKSVNDMASMRRSSTGAPATGHSVPGSGRNSHNSSRSELRVGAGANNVQSPPFLNAGSRQSSMNRMISSPVKRGTVSTYNTPPVTQGNSSMSRQSTSTREPSSASQSTANSSYMSQGRQQQLLQQQQEQQPVRAAQNSSSTTADLLNSVLDSQLSKGGIDPREVRICRQVKDLLLSISESGGRDLKSPVPPLPLNGQAFSPSHSPGGVVQQQETPEASFSTVQVSTPPSNKYLRQPQHGIQSVDSRHPDYGNNTAFSQNSHQPELELEPLHSGRAGEPLERTDPEDHSGDTISDPMNDLREVKKNIVGGISSGLGRSPSSIGKAPLEKSKSMSSFDIVEAEEEDKFKATMSAVLAAADEAMEGGGIDSILGDSVIRSELTEEEQIELSMLSGDGDGGYVGSSSSGGGNNKTHTNASHKRDPIMESQSDSDNSSWDGNASDHSNSGRHRKKTKHLRPRANTTSMLGSESENENETQESRNIPVESHEDRILERERQDVLQDIPEFETPSAPTHSKPKRARSLKNKTPRLDLPSVTPDRDQDECYVLNDRNHIVNSHIPPQETPRGSQLASQASSPDSLVSVGKLPLIANKNSKQLKGGRRVGKHGEVLQERFDHLIPGTSVTDPALLSGSKYPQCRSLVHRPTYVQPNEDKQNIPPRAQLYLEHVHGYNGDNGTTPLSDNNIIPSHVISSHNHNHVLCGSTGKLSGVNKGKNVLYLRDGRVMFPAAGLVVLMNIDTNEQSFFSGHTDDVTCLALNPNNGSVVASGQIGKEGKILIWNSANIVDNKMLTKAPIELSMTGSPTAAANVSAGVNNSNNNAASHINMRGVFAVDFSPDGKYLLAVGMDDMHTISIFDWRLSTVLVSSTIGRVDINKVQFNPYLYKPIDSIKDGNSPHKSHISPRDLEDGDPDSATSGCYTIISCGSRQVKFWTFYRVLERVDQDAPGKKHVHGGGFGVGRQMGKEFKGRQMHVPKRKQLWENKYILEGNAGIFPKNNPEVPEFTCFCCVENSPANPDVSSVYSSRIYCGTANGCIYVWKQLENKRGGDDGHQGQQEPQNGGQQHGGGNRNHNNNNKKGSDVKTKWLPRGKLLSIVTDIHSEPTSQITDMDYSGSYNDYIKKHYFYSNKDRYYHLYASKKKRRKFVEKIVTSGRDGYVNIWKIQKFSAEEIMNHKNAVMIAEQEGRDISNLIPLEHLSSYYVMSSLSNFEKYNELSSSPPAIGELEENQDLAVYDTNYASYGGVPRSIQWNDNCSAVIIGTTNNCIYELRANSALSHSPSKLQNNSNVGTANGTSNTGSGSETGNNVTGQSQISVASNNILSVDDDSAPDELVLQQIIRGHIGKVTRVTPHPYLPIYASISTDNSIRLWDLHGRHLINSCSSVVDRPTALQFSPNGLVLLVGNAYGELTVLDCGYEEDPSSDLDGELVYSHWKSQSMWTVPIKKQITKVPTTKDKNGQPLEGDRAGRREKERGSLAKTGINVIKFSPSGHVVAIGCKDSIIYILTTTQGFRRVSICKGHSSAIRQLDFCYSYASEDGENSDEGIILQSNDTVRELLYWDIMTGKQISVVNRVRDVAWSSWSCTVGWPVQVCMCVSVAGLYVCLSAAGLHVCLYCCLNAVGSCSLLLITLFISPLLLVLLCP